MLQKFKLEAYIKLYGEHWADVLPENCPPEEVCTADNDVFYRFTCPLPPKIEHLIAIEN